jgi:hypothetical protein
MMIWIEFLGIFLWGALPVSYQAVQILKMVAADGPKRGKHSDVFKVPVLVPYWDIKFYGECCN